MRLSLGTASPATPLGARVDEDPAAAPAPLGGVSSADLAECTCPEWCERDHDRD